MRIVDLITAGPPVFSFEFFPPKTEAGERNLYRTIEQLRESHPGFVSVTYGAGGSTREKTVEVVYRLKHEIGVETMAHVTCIGATRDELANLLSRLHADGIDNVLALRGDPPRSPEPVARAQPGFSYAAELVRFIRDQGWPFCVGGACYPEGHVEAPSLEVDLIHLKEKVDAGVDFLITQLFFDNRDYFAFLQRAVACGIRVPIIPGIMPITNVAQIERFTSMCGARISTGLRDRLHRVQDDVDSVMKIGVEHATAQCRDLLAQGAPGIHFYTLNQSPATRAILAELRS